MQVRSLGYRTDLIFVRFDGKVLDRGDFIVAQSPSNPTYYWGNFLLFEKPPQPGDFEVWQGLFKREFDRDPRVKHMTFGWDSPEGVVGMVEPFLQAGFTLEQGVVLATAQVNPPPRPNADIFVRPLATDAEWDLACQNQVTTRALGFEAASYMDFTKARMTRMRRMSRQGLGYWFGAFMGGKLVADLGVFREGELARFQTVGTLPEHRNLGIAGTMVYEASRFALERMGVKELVMVADQNYKAARIYESVGFKPVEKLLGLQLKPKSASL